LDNIFLLSGSRELPIRVYNQDYRLPALNELVCWEDPPRGEHRGDSGLKLCLFN